jgi:Txe/YoeB family toxin of Txe-Axe toxin-antitoxin module
LNNLEQNKNIIFQCKHCNKTYNARNSLWYHEKKCIPSALNAEKNAEKNEIVDYINLNEKDLIMKLLQQNNDLQNQLIEICKEKSVNIHNNSHNKTFNLNMFLNETCKNAMNITDFVDSLQLQMSDLENVGEVGYIEGISSIIIKKLNTLDITERPIHCTDKKRETMYIKDEDKWEKEDEKKTKMHKMVRKVANKNINLISEFQKLHPEWKKCSSKYADQHNKIVIESMGGKGDNEYEKQEKIIKKIAKEVFVDKGL